jgi:hypothetical protein
MKFQLGAMSVGDIMDRGFKLLMSRLGTFYLIQLIAILPFVLLTLGMPLLMGRGMGYFAAGLAIALILYVVLSQVASAAILHVVAEEYRDRRVGIGPALQFALGRFGALFATSLLAGLIIFSIPFVGFVVFITGTAMASPGLSLLGTLILLVGGVMAIIFALRYMLASPVVVVEDLAGMPALSRSKDLSSGYRGRIFGILFLIGLLGGIIGAALGGALEFVLPSGGQVVVVPPVGIGGQPTIQVTPTNFVNKATNTAATQLVNIFFGSYLAVCLVLVYFDLRVRKEGYDLELAAGAATDVAEPV